MASVRLTQVSVELPIYHVDSRSIKQQLVKTFATGGKLRSENKHCVVVRALDNITLQFEHGDRVGLLGHNGAGKSTLLRVLAQIYEPTAGRLEIFGRVTPLLDMMLGMNPEASGRENIFLRGIIQGMSLTQIEQCVPGIAEFTELGDYLTMPIRTYSTGMGLRLAFAIATSIQPEILLLDEIVGTGDNSFLVKAQQRLNRLIDSASIVVLAAHSEDIITQFCNKALVLESGKVLYYGACQQGIAVYKAHLEQRRLLKGR